MHKIFTLSLLSATALAVADLKHSKFEALSRMYKRQDYVYYETCAQTFGPGWVTCSYFPYCFDPSAGQTCCSNGQYCESGTYCTSAGCCPDGEVCDGFRISTLAAPPPSAAPPPTLYTATTSTTPVYVPPSVPVSPPSSPTPYTTTIPSYVPPPPPPSSPYSPSPDVYSTSTILYGTGTRPSKPTATSSVVYSTPAPSPTVPAQATGDAAPRLGLQTIIISFLVLGIWLSPP